MLVVGALIIVAELLFGAGFAAGTVLTELKVRRSPVWPVVEGVVTSYSAETKSGKNGSYLDERVTYEFDYNGQHWHGSRKALWPRELWLPLKPGPTIEPSQDLTIKPGRIVQVFVDPKSSEDSVLMLLAPFSNHAKIFFLIGLALLGKGLFVLVAIRKALKSGKLTLDRTAKWK